VKARPFGTPNQAVVDELILGRDIDQSCKNPGRAALEGKNFAGAPSGAKDRKGKAKHFGTASTAVVDEIILGRDIDQSGKSPGKAVLEGKNFAGAPSGAKDRKGKAKHFGTANTAVVDEIILGRDIDQSGMSPGKAALEGKNFAGAPSGTKDWHAKGRPFGCPNQAVMDEIVLGRDIDQSGTSRGKAALADWSKDAAGCPAPSDGERYPRLGLPARDHTGAFGLQSQKIKGQWTPERETRSKKNLLRMASTVGDVVFNNMFSRNKIATE